MDLVVTKYYRVYGTCDFYRGSYLRRTDGKFIIGLMVMNIKHHPKLNIEKAIEHYEKKDNVAITYICTTDLSASDFPVDIFYRESPHPDFGNRYFGLYHYNGDVIICNADCIESLEFGMIQDDEGTYHYSESHHDYKVIDGKMIDGGRMYIRCNSGYELFRVKDGQFIKEE